MNHIKITSKGWAGFNGQLSIVTFKDGVSVEPVPQIYIDRIAASVTIVACDAKGKELDGTALGIQNRLVGGVTLRADVVEPMARMSDQEKVLEDKLDANKSLVQPTEKLYTSDELTAIADKSGIKGLREIGNLWAVKGRAIPELITEILRAQSEFLAKREAIASQPQAATLRHTTRAEEVDVASVEVPDAPTIAGFEGLPEIYLAGEREIKSTQILEIALKRSGKSLTGWNTLTDRERQEFFDAEIVGLSKHFKVDLVAKPAPVVEEKTDAPEKTADAPAPEKAEETPADSTEPENGDPEKDADEGEGNESSES